MALTLNFKCPKCNKQFTSRKEVEDHCRRVHDDSNKVVGELQEDGGPANEDIRYVRNYMLGILIGLGIIVTAGLMTFLAYL